jgi:NAD(P)H-dependent flavin oxidoreductase YrpB (nitropropane dioxygenase family)
LIVKGKESAGTIRTEKSIDDLVGEIKSKYNKAVIAVGGIDSRTRIDQLISLGADAVGIGTLFAATVESCIHIDTKQKMISADNSDIKFIDIVDLPIGGKQKVLYFSEWDRTNDFTNRNGLYQSIRGEGGHVYVGDAIGSVKAILTVDELIAKLTR